MAETTISRAIIASAYYLCMPDVPLNDLSRWRDGEIEDLLSAFRSVLKSGSFMLGRLTHELEHEIARISGQQSAVAVANGTDALYLALKAIDVDDNWTVLNVANAGGYTTHAALRCGARVNFVDVDLETAQMSVDSLRKSLRLVKGPKVVVVTHLYGLMADIEAIAAACREFDARLVEDCAQATGATRGENLAGSFGDAATFSFYPTKNLAALGDAGAVALSSEEKVQKVRELSQYGWSERYKISRSGGVNSRIDELQSAVILARIQNLESENQIRRGIVQNYAQVLPSTRKFIWTDDASYVGHLAVMRSESRDSDIEKLRRDGVQCGVHYPVPDHLQPAWVSRFPNLGLPNTEKIVREILTVPCFPRLSSEEIRHVSHALSSLR